MIRIVAFTNVYPPTVGGVGTSVATFKRLLADYGIDVMVVSVDGGDIPVKSVPGSKIGGQFPIPIDISAAQWEQIRQFSPRAVWLHHFAGLGQVGLRFAQDLRLPAVYHWHTRYDHHARYAGVNPSRVNEVATWFANGCDAVVSPSSTMCRELQRLGVIRPIHVIPTPVEPLSIEVQRAPKVWSYCGRLSPEKNCGWLRQLAGLRPDWRGVVVGDGPSREELEGLPNVKLLGGMPNAQARAIVAGTSVFVMPSVSETQGLAPIEAMLSGVPVAAADCEINREVGAKVFSGVNDLATNLDATAASNDTGVARGYVPERLAPIMGRLLGTVRTNRVQHTGKISSARKAAEIAGAVLLPPQSNLRVALTHFTAAMSRLEGIW